MPCARCYGYIEIKTERVPAKRSENCLWLLQPLFLTMVSWLSDLNSLSLWAFSSPPWKEPRPTPNIHPGDTWDKRYQHILQIVGQHAVSVLTMSLAFCISNAPLRESLPFQPSLRSLQRSSFSEDLIAWLGQFSWKCQAGGLSAAGSWDEEGLAVCRSWISLGNSYF